MSARADLCGGRSVMVVPTATANHPGPLCKPVHIDNGCGLGHAFAPDVEGSF